MHCKQKKAEVFLTEIQGNKMQKIDLCPDCAKAKGVTDPKAFGFADLLLGLGASSEGGQAAGGVEVACPTCGYTKADFKKAGRLGCADCYHTFADDLEDLLKSIHKGTRHIGKVPRSLRLGRDLNDRLRGLQKKLEKAVADEDFEQAAVVRDEIKVTKDQISLTAAKC